MAKKKGAKAGRAKQKQKAQRSGGDPAWLTSVQRGSMATDNGDDDDDDDYSPNITFRGFNGMTSRHFTPTNPTIKLRHKSVAFISAGTSTPIELEPSVNNNEQVLIMEDAVQAELVVGSPSPVPASAFVMETELEELEVNLERLECTTQLVQMDGANDVRSISDDQALPYMVDTTGDLSIQPPIATSRINTAHRASSPTPSSSSEDVVVFRGRNKATVVNDPVPNPVFNTAPSSHPRKTKVTNSTQADSRRTESTNSTQGTSSKTESTNSTQANLHRKQDTWPSKLSSHTVEPDTGFTPAEPGAWWRKNKNATSTNYKEARLGDLSPARAAEIVQMARDGAELTTNALHASYLRARQEEQRARTANRFNHTTDHTRFHQKLSKREKQDRAGDERIMREMTDDESDPEEAAYRDYIENMEAQMDDPTNISDHNEATLQIQAEESAIVDIDDTTDWEDTGDSGDDSEDMIGQDFDEVYGHIVESNDIDQDTSELEDELEAAEREILQAEDQLHKSRMRSMTDEQIARLYAKQFELGIDADELLLDDGAIGYVDDDEGFGDVGAARSGLADYLALGKSSKRNGRRSHRRQQDRAFPDASALADAVEQYGNDGFDIMDLDRPSLRVTKKGRKGKLPAELEELSDEDLKENMRSAWDNDRAKKRLKKAEREELRAQGLLGALGKKGKADFDQKYQQGMNLSEIRVELTVFLQDDDQTTRSFPPMDKNDRKTLHEIANKLGLKSKSVGTGNSRAPVLYKTRSTADYSEAAMNRAIRVAGKHFLRNQSFRGEVAKKGAPSLKRSGGTAYTGLRHGELVGAGAKEIDENNFGSKLMEKMGWTRGTALGKSGEGVLHPVEQVMRVGKAGLG